ncbi:hypothetical protein JW851_03460 [Candidatus Woesearchaeota archaeon]|nr:hypothetical protein [Candidatus Woesearchaeota archaeon]
MFSKAYAVSLLKDAKSIIKKSGDIPVSNISRELTRRKILKKHNEIYYNNVFNFCRYVLRNSANKSQFIKEFNQMINFIESCDIFENCSSFVPKNAVVLSNISKLSSFTGNRLDIVLLKVEAISADSIILGPDAIKMLCFAKERDIPIYAVASFFSIDPHSIYRPNLCFNSLLFDGVISENGFEKFDSFIENSRKSFNWLFF